MSPRDEDDEEVEEDDEDDEDEGSLDDIFPLDSCLPRRGLVVTTTCC